METSNPLVLTKSESPLRKHVVAMLGEFCGTFMFLFFAYSGTQLAVQGAQASNTEESVADAPDTATLLYISFSFGMSLLVNVWIFSRISGGMFNPAV